MKISPKFFTNQLCKLLIGGVLLTPPISTFAQNKSEPKFNSKFPGVIESLEKLIEVDRLRFNKKNEIIAKNPKLGLDLNKVNFPEIDPDFLQSMVFHSDKRFLSLMGANPCALYALLETNLLRNSSGKITDVMIRYLGDKDFQYALVPKNDFAEKNYRSVCQDNLKHKDKYQNFRLTQTFQGLSIKVPQIEADCEPIVKEWQKNPETPYLCNVIDTITGAEKAQAELMRLGGADSRLKQDLLNQVQVATSMRRQISDEKYLYFKNLCNTVGNADQFCHSYFNISYWNKILGNLGQRADLEGRCQNILGKLALTEADYKACVVKINQSNEICHYEKSPFHNSLTPKPNCLNQSKALNVSRLYRDYQDCPASSGAEGVMSVGRILFHVSDEYRKNYVTKGEDQTLCFTKATAAFAKLNLDYEQNEAWGLRACYDDKINAREACFPMIMGHHPNSDFSEEKVILNILYKTKGAEKNSKCEVVSVQDFNPGLLKYRYGCFLIYDPQNCNGIYCPKKILFNEKEITHITYKYGVNFDLFPNNVTKERYAVTSLIENQIKLASMKITNITSLRFYLNQSPTYLIHGMGCAEDLLPSFFKKVLMNQCMPISFIVDGLIEKSGRAGLVVRTSLDDLHAPRILDWNHVYSSIKAFQEYHPMKLWGLYVIKR